MVTAWQPFLVTIHRAHYQLHCSKRLICITKDNICRASRCHLLDKVYQNQKKFAYLFLYSHCWFGGSSKILIDNKQMSLRVRLTVLQMLRSPACCDGQTANTPSLFFTYTHAHTFSHSAYQITFLLTTRIIFQLNCIFYYFRHLFLFTLFPTYSAFLIELHSLWTVLIELCNSATEFLYTVPSSISRVFRCIKHICATGVTSSASWGVL